LSFGSYKRKETKRLLGKRQLNQGLQRYFELKKWLREALVWQK
jgi:hypothetical protein